MPGFFRFIPAIVCVVSISAMAKVIDTIEVTGLPSQTQSSMVRTQSGLMVGAEFNSSRVQEAIKKLYYLGLYRTVNIFALNETDSTVSLRLDLSEFPQVDSIGFYGNKKISTDDLKKDLPVKRGQALSDQVLHDTRKAVQKVYEGKGYLQAGVTIDTVTSATPGAVIVKIKVKEGQHVEVKKVIFTGNVAFKESKLKGTFKTKEKFIFFGGDFDVEKYRSHLDSLVMFYNDEGYLDAGIVNDSVSYASKGKDITITIVVNEGRKYYFGNAFFVGNTVLSTDELAAQVTLKKGKPFNKTRFEMMGEAVSGRFREEGFLWVQRKDQQTLRGDTIDVTFNIVEGQPAIVRKIDINGNTKTRDNVVRREIILVPGRKYKQSMMMESLRRLNQLGFFGNVIPDIKPNEDGTVDFVINLVEKENNGQLSLGAAYSPSGGVSATFTTSMPNFRGTGEKLDLSLQYGPNQKSGSIGFTEPWAFNSPTTLSAGISGSLLEGSYGSTRSYGLYTSASRRLTWPDDKFIVTGGYAWNYYEDQYLRTPIEDASVTLRAKGKSSRLSLGVRRDDSDRNMFQTNGSIIDLNATIAGLGGDYRYAKLVSKMDNFSRIGYKFVLHPRITLGMLQPLGTGSMQVGQTDLFSAGGIYADGIVRGYQDDYNSGGITGYGGYSASRRTTLLAINTEVSYPVLEDQIYIITFFDMGNTWRSLGDVNLGDMYKGVGIGTRLMIPMLGMLGFDFGWGLDALPKGDFPDANFKPQMSFHFLINQNL